VGFRRLVGVLGVCGPLFSAEEDVRRGKIIRSKISPLAQIGPPRIGRSFDEKLLLMIIDAYPVRAPGKAPATDEKERETRLRTALKALFGYPKPKKKPKTMDDATLLQMGLGYYHDEYMSSPSPFTGEYLAKGHKVRSVRRLAADAIEQVTKKKAHPSSIDRVREKFSKNKEGWLAVAYHYHSEGDQIEFESLKIISEQLNSLGVKTNLARVKRTGT
jgi:hypothetical protein